MKDFKRKLKALSNKTSNYNQSVIDLIKYIATTTNPNHAQQFYDWAESTPYTGKAITKIIKHLVKLDYGYDNNKLCFKNKTRSKVQQAKRLDELNKIADATTIKECEAFLFPKSDNMKKITNGARTMSLCKSLLKQGDLPSHLHNELLKFVNETEELRELLNAA